MIRLCVLVARILLKHGSDKVKKKNTGTVIVVTAFTKKGRESLGVQRADEESVRLKYKGVPRWKIPVKVRSYLKTVSAFTNHADGMPKKHEILGFSKMSGHQRSYIYQGIRAAMYENGCSLDDFGVGYRE